MRKEIPILYSTVMAQAKLAWRKTQTRRIVKPQPIGDDLTWPVEDSHIDIYDAVKCNQCPYGKPRDLLFGRETVANLNIDFPDQDPYWVYKADLEHPNQHGPVTWKPSIHMPKEAARIWDEVTGIRVERVADISEEDAIAEGIEIGYHTFSDKSKHIAYRDYSKPDNKHEDYFSMPRNSFRSLWQLINGKPKPIQSKKGGKLITTGYEVYPFDEQAAAEFQGLTTWKGKPLTVITNPWVWVIESKQLSVTGKPAVPAAGKE
jgi:hypothetical protein